MPPGYINSLHVKIHNLDSNVKDINKATFYTLYTVFKIAYK